MFSNKPTFVLHLTRDKLVLFSRRSLLSQITFPYELLDNLEVKDASHISAQISEFIANNKLKHERIVIIIDQSAAFHKAVPLPEDGDIMAAVQDFAAMIPLPEANKQTLFIRRKDKVFLFAANKQLLQLLIDGLETASNKILAAVPAAAYGIQLNIKADQETLGKLFSHRKWEEAANFLAGSSGKLHR